MIGKVDPDQLRETILTRTGAEDNAVIQGPAYGEDTAAINLGDDILVVNADPLSLAADAVGELGVAIVCNDVAASGARPRWLTNMIFLPDDDPETLEEITGQVDSAATAQNVAIVGGHAEYAPDLSRPLLALSAMGRTEKYCPTGGARPGDVVIVTAGAALEGTAILATDFESALKDSGVSADTISTAATFLDEISVVDEALVASEFATGMHDPTEGGLLAGLVEMAVASGARFEIDHEAIPIREETARICAVIEVDPLRIFGSGALIVTVPSDQADAAIEAIEATGVTAQAVGSVAEGAPGVAVDDDFLASAPRDELYELWT